MTVEIFSLTKTRTDRSVALNETYRSTRGNGVNLIVIRAYSLKFKSASLQERAVLKIWHYKPSIRNPREVEIFIILRRYHLLERNGLIYITIKTGILIWYAI